MCLGELGEDCHALALTFALDSKLISFLPRGITLIIIVDITCDILNHRKGQVSQIKQPVMSN
jgi:hypothetical protein